MPTFTKIALHTLHQPPLRDSNNSSSNLKQQTAKFVDVTDVEKERRNPNPPTRGHIYISPALYTTPELTPVSSSSVDSLTTSPYVFNRKGRGGGKAFGRRVDVFVSEEINRVEDERNSNGGEFENEDELQVEEGVYDDFLGAELVGTRDEDAVLDEDFLDPRCETSSVASSSSRLNGFRREVENFSSASNQGDFFDADEELFSDGSVSNVPSCAQSVESVLRATRLSLLEEIEKRKISEEALDLMSNQWLRIADVLSRAGLTLSSPSNVSSSMQIDFNSIEQFIQEIIVAKFVAEAIEKGQARAEAEKDAEEIIQSKDYEISRLRDRLQYYEAVNREMSQRNQEVMEVARRERQRKKSRQQWWLWGCIGLSITVGATVIAYSCIPQIGQRDFTFQPSIDSSDASSVISSDSA